MTLTSYETAVLQALARSPSPLGWYSIEIRLMCMPGQRPYAHLPTVLRELCGRGYIEEVNSEGMPTERYAITVAGRAALAG